MTGRVMTCLWGKLYISGPSYCLFISNKPRAKERNIGMPDVILFQVVRKILPKQKFHIWEINLQGILFPLFYSRSNTFRSKCLSLWITITPAGNHRLKIFEIKLSVEGKLKSSPITGLNRPWGFQEAEVPRFQDTRHMKVVRLSAPRTGRFYSFLLKAESTPQGCSAAGRIMSTKSYNDTIGNRTRDLPACSAVPQPTAPPAACPKCRR